MKPAAFATAVFLCLGTTANSQWSILPQVGIEKLNSSLHVNGAKVISSLDGNSSFKAALRSDYRFKGGHGPYVSVGSSPSAIQLNFSNPESPINSFAKEVNDLQWRLEGGYGYSSKPIYFKKGAAKKSATTTRAKEETRTILVKKSCGSYTYTYRCQRSKEPQKQLKNTALNMRLQPSVGMAYLPNTKETMAQEGASYIYRAGNWKTALVSSMGFEFAKGANRFMTLQLSYTKGIGNLDTRTLSAVSGAKTVVTSLRSTASSWALTAGVPLVLGKKPAVKAAPKQEVEKTKIYKRCGRTVI
ncbi:MAG TPA: hypothetical protein VD794_05670 [Flavisolibacter sp.]|nr:hypothetical protein [Flavisolibacter sp.]